MHIRRKDKFSGLPQVLGQKYVTQCISSNVEERIHEPLVRLGLLPHLCDILQEEQKKLNEIDPNDITTDLFLAASIAADISWPG